MSGMCVDAAHDRSWYHCHVQNGGDKFINEIGETGVQFFRQYLQNLPMIIQINHRGLKIGLVHAACPLKYTDWNEFLTDTASLNAQVLEDCLWERKDFDFARKNVTYNSPRISNVDYVLSGHTAINDPLIYGNRSWIDSQFNTGDLTIATPQNGKMRYLRREHDAYSFDRKRGY